MRYLTLIIMFFTILIPATGHAQSGMLPIAPCFYRLDEYGNRISTVGEIASIRADGVTNMVISQEVWHQALRHNEHLALSQIEGEQVRWLDYAKQGEEWKEWYGEQAAYEGVNLFHLGAYPPYGVEMVLTLYDANKAVIGRIEAEKYDLDDTWILFITAVEPFGLTDGSRYDYHPLENPTGGACVFKVEGTDFEEALGWQ